MHIHTTKQCMNSVLAVGEGLKMRPGACLHTKVDLEQHMLREKHCEWLTKLHLSHKTQMFTVCISLLNYFELHFRLQRVFENASLLTHAFSVVPFFARNMWCETNANDPPKSLAPYRQAFTLGWATRGYKLQCCSVPFGNRSCRPNHA